MWYPYVHESSGEYLRIKQGAITMTNKENRQVVIVGALVAVLLLFPAVHSVMASSIEMCFLDVVIIDISPDGRDHAQVEFEIRGITEAGYRGTGGTCERFDPPDEYRNETVAFRNEEVRNDLKPGDIVILMFQRIHSHPTPENVIRTSSSWSFMEVVSHSSDDNGKDTP